MRGSMCVCVCEAVVGRFGVTTWCWVVCLGFGWYNGGLQVYVYVCVCVFMTVLILIIITIKEINRSRMSSKSIKFSLAFPRCRFCIMKTITARQPSKTSEHNVKRKKNNNSQFSFRTDFQTRQIVNSYAMPNFFLQSLRFQGQNNVYMYVQEQFPPVYIL